MKSFYQIGEIVGPTDGRMPKNRFWLLEVYWSCDGPRSRITDKKFATLVEAEEWVRLHG